MSLDMAPVQRRPDELLKLYFLNDQDLSLIRRIGAQVIPQLMSILDTFYEWMSSYPDMMGYFRNKEAVVHTKLMQQRYWNSFFEANIDQSFINERHRVGIIHAQINLPVVLYFSAVNMLYDLIKGKGSVHHPDIDQARASMATIKLLHMDAALVCQAFTDRRDQIIADNSRLVMEMSTPVTTIWDGVLLLPVVGIVDSRRSETIMSAVLSAIAKENAREFILDISGVGVVDTAVANYLIQITKAASLMGCRSTISGISPAIAQTLVQLGVEVKSVRTTSTLMDALKKAFERLNIQLLSMS